MVIATSCGDDAIRLESTALFLSSGFIVMNSKKFVDSELGAKFGVYYHPAFYAKVYRFHSGPTKNHVQRKSRRFLM